MPRFLVVSVLALALAACGRARSTTTVPARATSVYPGADWETVADPVAAGWDAAWLDTVRSRVAALPTTGLMVVEHGRVILAYGDLTRESYLASVRKSVLSMLYGIEIARGHIDTALTLRQLGITDRGGLLPSELDATVQDLLGARSGVYHEASNAGDNLADAPPRGSRRHGTYTLYSNWDFNVLGTIFEQLTGRNIYDAVERELALPIGMQDWRRDLQEKSGDTTRSRHLAYHMWFSTRDMARLGYLMLRGGRWGDRQIVPADWVRASTRPITPVTQMNPSSMRRSRFGYGYLWWVVDGAWNTGPYEGAYSGMGAIGQYITVIPRLDLVVAHKTEPREGNPGVGQTRYLALLDRIVAARTGRLPTPGPGAVLPYDILVRNGTVIDGRGAPAARADIAVVGTRIARLSTTPLSPDSAFRVIDATGLVVTPGFIDAHLHIDPLLRLPSAESSVRQGVTLALGGPCGDSPWPFGTYLDSADRAGLGMNVAYLVGHNTIRRVVMGTADRAPTPDELSRMRAMVARAMSEGAFGLSTGLRYVPGTYASTDEVVALAQVAADSGGIYATHLREEGVGLIGAVAEALEIGRRAHVPVEISHHKAIGRAMWGSSVRTLAMIDSARAAGTDVALDQYPYTASSTGLSVLVPTWALAGGDSALRRRVGEPVLRDSIRRGIVENLLNDRGGGDLRRVQFSRVPWDSSLEGRTLHDWAVRRGIEPVPERAADLVLEGVLNGGASMVFHVIDEADVRRILAHPQTMIGSDGRLTRPGEGVPHPRSYGTFPRVLGRYVRDERVLTLEEAVHKMTGLPAERLRLHDHGCVQVGCVADLTLFDAATVGDVGTYEDPHRYPRGIVYVLVNGVPVVERGEMTSAHPGRVLRRPRS